MQCVIKLQVTRRRRGVFMRGGLESAGMELPLRCPCCYAPLEERHEWIICSVCEWEDDGQDDHDADKVYGGPNGGLSLTAARENFHRYGTCHGGKSRHRG
jgi:hypothetical protein